MAFRKGGPYSLWWPLSFLICWLVFCVTGGGLIGGSFNQGSITYCYEEGACDDGPDQGMLIAGYAFVSLGGVCASIFWILLIIWLVKRNRHTAPQNMHYGNYPQTQQQHQPPPMGGPAPGSMPYQQYTPQAYGQHPHGQPYGQPYMQQPYGYGPPPPQQYRSDPSSPPAAAMASPQSLHNHAPSGQPNGAVPAQDKKTCGSCGATVTTPFCAQCGAQSA